MSLINDALKRAKQTHRQQSTTPDTATMIVAMPPLQSVENSTVGGASPSGATRILWVVPLLILLVGLSGWFLWQWSAVDMKTASPTLAATPASTPSAERVKKNPLEITAATVAQVTARAQGEETSRMELVSKQNTVSTAPRLDPTTSSALTAAATPSVGTPAPANAAASAPQLASAPATAPTAIGQPNVTLATSTPPAAPVANALVDVGATPVPTPAAIQSAAPAPPPALAPPKFKLQGIFYRIKNPTALVNDRIVSAGDDIDGYRVVQIERQSVKLAVPGHTNVVTLY